MSIEFALSTLETSRRNRTEWSDRPTPVQPRRNIIMCQPVAIETPQVHRRLAELWEFETWEIN